MAWTGHIYYLHGGIIEEQGANGVSPKYGAYDYGGILASLRSPGVTVLSELRPKGTDASAYADRIVDQIRADLARGVPAARIKVIGASKGAVIAALVSTRLEEPQIAYVLLANCNDWLIRTHNPRLSGNVLSIYDAADEIGKSCDNVRRNASPYLARYEEIRLTTGLGHGFVYNARPEWVEPAIRWAQDR
ncbi:MAG: alpha/beta hydrolase [Sphingosinicella sp.]|nr:alpha/beta hydrolase [Sphingosinicella sp.]